MAHASESLGCESFVLRLLSDANKFRKYSGMRNEKSALENSSLLEHLEQVQRTAISIIAQRSCV